MPAFALVRLGGFALASLVLAGACGGGNGTGNTGSIQVSVNPSSLSVIQGGTGTITITLTRSGGFEGAVSITVTGLPAGITFSVAPSPITATTTTATVTVNVAPTVATGNYTATVQASGSGVSSASATYAVTVTEMPNYSLSLDPAELSIQQNQNGNATVTITRTGGFVGAVTLSLENPPPGVTVVFAPNNTSGNSSTITVDVAGAVAAGFYQLTVKGEAQGLTTVPGTDSRASAVGDRTVGLSLTVSLAVPEPVEFQFCSPEFNPIFFAYQDGSGPWTRVEPVLQNTVFKYRFALHHFRGGVYYVQETPLTQGISLGTRSSPMSLPRFQSGGGSRPRSGPTESRPGFPPPTHPTAAANGFEYFTEVLYFTLPQFQQVGMDLCPATVFDPGKTVRVPFSNIPPGQYGVLGMGGASISFLGEDPSPVTMQPVRSGRVDLVGSRATSSNDVVNRVLKLTNQEPGDGATLATGADFLGPNSWAPATAQFSFSVPPGTLLAPFTSYFTENGFVGQVDAFKGFTTATSLTVYGFPAPQVLPNEVHQFTSVILPPAAGSFDEFRLVLDHLGPMLNRNVVPLDPITGLTATLVNPARRLFSATADVQAAADRYAEVFFVDASGTVTQNVDRSAEYTAAGPVGTGLPHVLLQPLVMPDLSALPGFPSASLLPPGGVDVTLVAQTWSGADRRLVFPRTPPVGLLQREAWRTIHLSAP